MFWMHTCSLCKKSILCLANDRFLAFLWSFVDNWVEVQLFCSKSGYWAFIILVFKFSVQSHCCGYLTIMGDYLRQYGTSINSYIKWNLYWSEAFQLIRDFLRKQIALIKEIDIDKAIMQEKEMHNNTSLICRFILALTRL